MFHSKQDVDRHVNEVFRNIKSDYQRNSKCYQIAKLYYKFQDYKSAIKYINRYILTTTNSAAAYRLLGECYLGENLKVKALDSFKTSLELNGSQNDLVLKICTLLMDPDVCTVTPRATYWLERAEALFPTNPVVFQLREHILKLNLDGKQDNEQLEKLILSEISARPVDVVVRIRLLNFFVDTKRYKIAYQHALETEEKNIFSNDLRWYECLCNIVQAYEKANSDLGFSFYIKKIIFFERRADLSMQEFQEEVKTLPECSAALFDFDQALHSVSKIKVPRKEMYFYSEFMKHMKTQLSFHLATLALKRAKKEYGIWSKAIRTASPLLLQATQNTMDLEEPWDGKDGKNKMEWDVKQLNKSASFRISQAGHILLAWSQSKGPKFLEKVSQFCGGKWQNHVYQDVFYNREHQQAIATSHFVNDPFFTTVPMRLLLYSDLKYFDEVSQSTYPDSLHHLVWLGLAYCNANGLLSHDFRCTIVPELQFTVSNLSQTGPETLNQLDVDAFLYASVLCAKSSIPNIVSTERPSRLPVSISDELCSPAQADWWAAVYKTYTNQTTGNLADIRLRLRKGIEVIRVFGQHGLHVKIIVMLAKLFQERAAKNKNPDELTALEDRAYLYWTAAIPLLERLEKNQLLREVPNRLLDYRGKDLSPNEIKNHLEDGKLFLACRLMKQGRHEQAIEAFQSLKSPYATFYQALLYEKLASEEVNRRPESITSEDRSQHIILLTRARDALYLTLDRLRSPSVDPNHPLNAQLQDNLDEIEKQLAIIDPDNNLNRNGDSQSDETDTVPGPLSPDVDENLESSFNMFNTSNFLNLKNHSTSRTLRHNISDKYHTSRFEARPSPERLDAQLRHLVQANSNGLKAIVEQLKEIKSTMQIELKDLGCVTRDLLAEMKRWNEKLESVLKRTTDVLKPEDVFELREEDYEDISQLSQPYTPYQNYQLNRQMPGTQGTATVAYGTPNSSSVPPVPPVIPTPDNSLIPPAFYPGTHPVPPIDPSLLLYQSLGYYAPGMPYGENQNVPDYRGTGIQKGVPFAKTYKVPDSVATTTALSTKPQPPNVVITSSDTLPAFTSAGTPEMRVTVPPQHIRGLMPSSITQKPSPSQVHPFQIQMPPQAQLVKESPTDKLNSLIPAASFSTNPIQTDLVSGVKPTPFEQTTPLKGIDQTKLVPQIKAPKENVIQEQKLEGNKLFESRGKLSVFDLQWREKGVFVVKIIHDDKLGKVKILILQEPGFTVFVDHYITPDMVIEPLMDSEYGWAWTSCSTQQTGAKANEAMGTQVNWQKFRVQFNTFDESKDFEFAFNEGRRITKEIVQNEMKKSTPLEEIKAKECVKCKARIEKNSEKCSACENKEKSNDKTNLGGFAFTSSPIVKSPILKLNEQKDKPKEQPKPSPFSNFSFSSVAATTPNKADSQPETTKPKDSDVQNISSTGSTFNWFAGVKADPNSFKKDANFKNFEGKDSPVFGYLKNLKTSDSESKKTSTTPKTTKSQEEEEEDEDDGEEDSASTAEFKPVVDLPDLVDMKTGEENDEVLYGEKATLLRFDKTSKEWKERGVGEMRVLFNKESGKVRLIMRREVVLKVCCNHYLDESMEFKRLTKSEKALTWYAQDYSEGTLKLELFALKFANPDAMVRFETAIKNAQLKIKDGRGENLKKTENAEEKSNELKPLKELFKHKAGSWECGTCLIRNDETATTCVSCTAPKPGTQTKANESTTKNSGLGRGLIFPPSSGKFNFGIPQTTETVPVSTSTAKCIFGLPQNTSSSGFQFGANMSTSTNSVPAGTSQTPKFTFGFPRTTTAPSDSSSNKNLFAKSTTFGVSNTETISTPSFSFGIPQLSVTSSVSLSTPALNFSIPKTENSTVSTPKTFSLNFSKTEEGKSEISSGAPQPSFPLFTTALKPEGKEKFEFSLSNIKPETAKTTSPKKKGGDGATSEDSEEEPENDSGDNIIVKPVVPLPDKVAVNTGEENEDVMYERRATLFRFIDKQWKERGVGDIRILKHRTNNKIRLLMRRETILKVCLNHYLAPDIEFTAKDEKTWTWSAADFSEEKVRYDIFAIRFKTPEFAQEFKKALEDVRNNVSPSPSAEKAKESSETMKNFTFAVTNPSKSEPPKNIQTGTTDDDILIVYENQVTPEQREKAISLHLPPNFYAYLQAPDCPGCPGCEKDDTSAQTQQSSQPDSSNKPAFEVKPWGSLNFGKNDNSENKVLFTFAGNQGGTKPNLTWNPISTAQKITKDAESNSGGKKEMKEEDDDVDEDDDDDDVEDDDDDNDDDEDDDDNDDEDEEDLQEEEYEDIGEDEENDDEENDDDEDDEGEGKNEDEEEEDENKDNEDDENDDDDEDEDEDEQNN